MRFDSETDIDKRMTMANMVSLDKDLEIQQNKKSNRLSEQLDSNENVDLLGERKIINVIPTPRAQDMRSEKYESKIMCRTREKKEDFEEMEENKEIAVKIVQSEIND